MYLVKMKQKYWKNKFCKKWKHMIFNKNNNNKY